MNKVIIVILSAFLLLFVFNVNIHAAPVRKYTQNDIQNIKLYSKISDQYREIESIGSMLQVDEFRLAIVTYNDAGKEDFKTNIERTKFVCNETLKSIKLLESEAKKKKINISDMQTALLHYNQAISDYYAAFKSLNNNDFKQFIYHMEQASKNRINGYAIGFDGSTRFYKAIQGY